MFPLWFHKKSTENSQAETAVTRADLEGLLARFDRLNSDFKTIRLEWADVYDKVQHLFDRTRKRIGALKRAEDRSEQPNGASNDPEPTSPKTHADIMNFARSRGQFR